MTSRIEYSGDLSTKCTHVKSQSSITTDAPLDNNGLGRTFSPTDLVATALASCLITVMGIKANQSKISYKYVEASVLKTMGTNPRRITKLDVEVIVGDKWTEEEKQLLENVARTCPVANSLSVGVEQNISFTYK